MLVLIDYVVIALIVYVIGIHVNASWRLRRLEKRSRRVDGDINTLHHNEGVILSSVNELSKEMRKHEKNTKLIKRHVRSIPSQEKEGEAGE